jgi:adenosylcobinamide-phosphate synthase
VNVRLGGEALKAATFGPQAFRASGVEGMVDTESTPGREAEVGHLRSIVGLVWRSVLLWMVLLALLTGARLLG